MSFFSILLSHVTQSPNAWVSHVYNSSLFTMNDNRRRVILVAVGVTVGIVLTPVVAPAILYGLGFSAIGPVAGTTAATIQAGIGNVAAGSFFAMAQSAAMGGAIPAVFTAIGAGLGGLIGAVFSTRLASEIMRQVTRAASPVVAGIRAAAAKVAGAWRRFSSWFQKGERCRV
ncbi:hypothetical protein EDB83DRAFT_543311 [Lactarius deliciosus]|nr:hypothetical protein EDB83DRAFT_543311 [Lactarius deliciosus]